MTQITITMSSPDEALRGLDKITHRKVWIRSANKTIAKAKTTASKEIRAEYFIRAEDVGSRVLKTFNASAARPEALLRARSPRLALTRFKVSPAMPTFPGPRIGAKVRVRRDSRGARIPGTFVAIMESGHVGVFKRVPGQRMKTNPKRQKIEEKTGPSPADLLASERVFKRVGTLLAEDAQRIFAHELVFELNRTGQGRRT